jgi:hypothetical protein
MVLIQTVTRASDRTTTTTTTKFHSLQIAANQQKNSSKSIDSEN